LRGLIRKAGRDSSLKYVALTGGEPLVREDLPEIVCDLTDDGLGVVTITNARLLTEARLRRFPEGSAFEITLFSADEELHNQMAGGKVFQKVLEVVAGLHRHGCHFVLSCVIGRANAHDVKRTIELGIALGAGAVLFNRINLTGRSMPHYRELLPTAGQLRESLSAADDAAARYGIPVAVSVPIPPCVVEPADYPHLIFGWCPRGGEKSYYTIGCTGLLRPCNHSSVVLGDLCEQSFAEIVGSRKTREFWQPAPAACLNCKHPLAAQCRGGCPAAADECFGTRERMDPLVELSAEVNR
jgi:radical SAM protein with 4Fe4S-binding SPASM domain